MFSKNTYANDDLSTSSVVRIQAKSLKPNRCLLPLYSGMEEAHYFLGDDDEPVARTFFVDNTLVVLTTIKRTIVVVDEITCGSIRIKYLKDLFVMQAYDENIPCTDLDMTLRGRYNVTHDVKINCGTLRLEKNSSIKANTMSLVVQGLLDLDGCLFSYSDLSIHASSINISLSASIKAKKMLLTSAQLFSRGEIQTSSLVMRVSKRLYFGNRAFTLSKKIDISAGSLCNYGGIRPIKHLMLNIKEDISLYSGAIICCDEKIDIFASSLWNEGTISALKTIKIAVDRICANGFVKADSVYDMLTKRANITSNELTIVAAGMMNFPGCTLEGKNQLFVSSLIHIDVASLSLAYTSSIKTLFRLQCANLSLPHPNKIMHVIEELCSGNLMVLDPSAGIDNFYDKWVTRLMTLSSSLSILLPGLSNIIQTSSNILSMLLQAKSIYGQISKLYENHSTQGVHLRDVIPILVTGVGIAQTGLSLKNNLDDVKKEYKAYKEQEKWDSYLQRADFDKNLGKALLSSTATLCMPSSTTQAVTEVSVGAQEVSGSINHTSVLSYRSEGSNQLGYQVSIHSLEKAIDNGLTRAKQMLVKGKSVEQGGLWKADNFSFSGVDDSSLVQTQKGTISANKGNIEASSFIQKGQVKIAQANIKLNTHQQTNTASSHYGRNSTYKTQTLSNQGKLFGNGMNFTADNLQQMGDFELHNSYLETKQFETNQQSHTNLNHVGWNAGNTQCNAKLSANTVNMISEGQVHFAKESHIVAKNSYFEGENMQLDGTGEIEDRVEFKARNTANQSEHSAFTGSGELVLTSTSGSIEGEITTKSFVLNKDDTQDTMDILQSNNQYLRIKPQESLTINTKHPITITKSIESDIGINLIAPSVDVDAAMKSQYELTLTALEKNVKINANLAANEVVLNAQQNIENNGGKVHGNTVFLNTEEGSLNNTGGTFKADEYLQATIAEDINNRAKEGDTWTSIGSNIKTWEPGVLSGGVGAEHDGIGAVIQVGGKVINDGSSIKSIGRNEVSAKEGILSYSKTNTFITYNDGHGNYGVTTQFQPAEIISEQGHNTLHSENGQVRLVATYLNAAEGTDIIAKGKVIFDAVALSEGAHTSHKKGPFGLGGRTKEDQTYEIGVGTRIVNTDTDNVRIHSIEDDVVGVGLTIVNPNGRTEITGNYVDLSKQVLNHSVTIEERRLGLKVFGHDIGGGDKRPVLQMDDTVQQLTNLANSRDATEFLLNTVNAGTSAVNAINTLSVASQNGNVVETIANRVGIQTRPSVGISNTKTHYEHHYQTLGEGSIESGEIVFNAREKVTLNGIDIDADKMSVHAPKFEYSATPLHGRTKYTKNTVDVTFTENTIDVGISGARTTSQQTTYVPVHLNVGEFHLEANTATFTNAQVHCNTLTGHVDTLNLQSIPDSFQSESSHFAASTTGVVNFGRGTTQSLSLPNPCHLHVVNDVDGAFTVGVAHITGAKVTSGGVGNLNAEKIISKPVTTYSKSSGRSFGVSLNQSTFNLGKNKSHRIDKQDSVLYGQKGTKSKAIVEGDLHTASADGGKMLVEEKSRKRAINVPLPTHENQKRFKHAFEVLKSQDLFIPQKQAVDWQVLREHYPQETEQSISEKIKLAHFFSQQAYEKDCGVQAASDKGYQLVGKYKDSPTDSTIAVYINPHNQQGVIAFAGSVKKAWFTDDVDIFVGKSLRSMTKTPVIDFINKQIQQHPETSFTLTGHSRGASQASIASDLFGAPAIVFDNPGVTSKQGYTFSKVISFQSTPNIVNAIDDITARPYTYGTEIRLQANADEQILNAGATLLGNALHQPLVSGLLFGGQTFFSHTNKQIGAKLDEFLDEVGEMDVILTQ